MIVKVAMVYQRCLVLRCIRVILVLLKTGWAGRNHGTLNSGWVLCSKIVLLGIWVLELFDLKDKIAELVYLVMAIPARFACDWSERLWEAASNSATVLSRSRPSVAACWSVTEHLKMGSGYYALQDPEKVSVSAVLLEQEQSSEADSVVLRYQQAL